MRTTSGSIGFRKTHLESTLLTKLTFGPVPGSDPSRPVVIPDLFSDSPDPEALWDLLMQRLHDYGGYDSDANLAYRLPVMLPPAVLDSNPIQPTVRTEDWAIRIDLAKTITHSAFIQPITCAPDPHQRGRFIIGDGEGRVILSVVNDLPLVPAIVFLMKPELLFLVDNAGSKRVTPAQVFQIYGELTERGEFHLRDVHLATMSDSTKKAIRALTTHLQPESEWLKLAKTGTVAPSIIHTAVDFWKAMDASRRDTVGQLNSKVGLMPVIARTLLWMRDFNMWESCKNLLNAQESKFRRDAMNQARFAINEYCGIRVNPDMSWTMDPSILPKGSSQTSRTTTNRSRRSSRSKFAMPATDLAEVFAMS